MGKNRKFAVREKPQEFVGYFQKDFISCIMLTYSQPSKCFRAIENFLSQDYSEKELIIINNGSSTYFDIIDEFLRKKAKPNIKHFFVRINPKASVGEYRNIALKQCSGEYVCIWDDDDFSSNNRLSYQLEELKKFEKQNNCKCYSLLENFNLCFETSLKKKASVKEGLDGTLMFHNDIFVGKVILFNDEVQKNEYETFFRGLDVIGYTKYVINNADNGIFNFERNSFNLQGVSFFEKMLFFDGKQKNKKNDDFILECEKKLQSLRNKNLKQKSFIEDGE